MLTLSIQNLSVHFSGNHVINDVSATLHGGEMVAVVGRNGVGKTTLIKAIVVSSSVTSRRFPSRISSMVNVSPI